MQSAPQIVATAGFVLFAATGAALGYTVMSTDPFGTREHKVAYRSHAQPEYQPAEFSRIDGTIHAIDQKQRTVMLDNGGTYALPGNIEFTRVQVGDRVTVATSHGTAFVFFDD